MKNLGYCQLCNKKVGYHVASHFEEVHPEYGFTRTHRDYRGRQQKLVYACTTCSCIVSGFGELVRHYKKFHPKNISPTSSLTKVQDIPAPAEESYDSIAEIIGHLNEKVRELKGDNDVLSKSMVEIASALHKAMDEAAELQQENDNLCKINDSLNNRIVERQGMFQKVMVEARQLLGRGD